MDLDGDGKLYPEELRQYLKSKGRYGFDNCVMYATNELC